MSHRTLPHINTLAPRSKQTPTPSFLSSTPPTMASNSTSNSRPIVVKRGLDDLDEHIDLLGEYFTEMQNSTVEATLPADLISFAEFAHYFGVIMVDHEEGESVDECGDEDAEGEPEEESEAVALAIYPESTATVRTTLS